MSVINEIKHYLAEKLIIKEQVDTETADWRFDICLKCDKRNEDENTCTVCGCFLDLKTSSRVNYRVKKNRNEITHCPLGRWNDLEIANEYRRIDGKEPLIEKKLK